MSDLAKEIRKAYFDAINGTIALYDAQAPDSAVAPYAVLVTIDYSQTDVKACRMYTASVTLDLYNEFSENGGNSAIDNLAQTIIDLVVPQSGYLLLNGYKIYLSRVENIFNDKADATPVRVFRKKIIITHQVQQT